MAELTVTADHPFTPKNRVTPNACKDCNKVPEVHPATKRLRDRPAELRLLKLAAEAAGFHGQLDEPHWVVETLVAAGLQREHLGPGDPEYIHLPDGRNLLVDIAEEIIDAARHYCTWAAEEAEPGMAAGDHAAATRYTQAMGALVHLLRAWDALHTKPG